MYRLRTLALLAALAAPAAMTGSALAQNDAPAAAATEGQAAPAAAEAPGRVVDTFEASPALEPMRYRHLWIAYSAIWFLVFFFMFRTWKTSQSTAAELDGLKRRLADLEGKGGTDGN